MSVQDRTPERVRLVTAAEDAVWCRIPDHILEAAGLREGDRVEVTVEGGRILVRKA